jgi:predicted amidohydrolase
MPGTFLAIPRIRGMRNLLALLLWIVSTALLSFASDLALVGGKIYPSPGDRPIQNGVVLVHDGRITAVEPEGKIKIPGSATVIACKGLVITAGFWNSHVHILTPDLLHAKTHPSDQLSSQLERMFTRWGFTTVFDIASVLENTNNIRHGMERGEIRGPRILTVGEPFYPQGGTPIYIRGFLEENHIPSAEVDSSTQAVARVRQQVRDGADGIKIFAGAIMGGGKVLPMPLDIARAPSFPKLMVLVNLYSRIPPTWKDWKLVEKKCKRPPLQPAFHEARTKPTSWAR